MVRLFFALLLSGFLYSCGPTEWYNSEIIIPEAGWHLDTVAVFNSEVEALDKSVHLLIDVKNKRTYPYSNIWFFVDAVSPNGHRERDTLECNLANVQGKWYGKSIGDDTYESVHPYKLNIRFPEKGMYHYYIMQGMRDTILTGIKSVGLKIIEVENK